jgi:RHS repeat-associated protein
LPKSLPIRPTKPIFAKSVAVLYKTVLAVPVWDEENRLRLVDTNPSTKDPEGIAVYTYDAGGERAIKKVINSGFWSVNEPNTLQTTSARKGSFTANLYPSGLLNVKVYKKLSCSGNRCVSTNVQSYTKHYYAGSQRVMSKVGSDKNIGKFDCSWLIIPFSEGATPAEKPEETLAKAQRSEDEMLKPYNITPAPDYGQNAGYENAYKSKCVDTHGIDFAAEKAQSYWYHSDHLGSASYITGVDGKVCSNITYFPTGEVFVEQNRQIFNLPYKFNGKELDAETGYYYYGARYYNPKVSLWLNVDPLADYNPHMNDEHYKDGEHNGGVFNQMNNNPYIYCYQSPVVYIDPNGKQVHSVDWKAAGRGLVKGLIYGVAIGTVATVLIASGGTAAPVVAYGLAAYGAYQTGKTGYEVIGGKEAYTGRQLSNSERSELAGEMIGGAIGGGAGVKIGGKINIGSRNSNITSVPKPYSNSRPSYGKNQVNDVWTAAKQKDGKVYDPNTGEELIWNTSGKRSWDMGHKPGKEYWRLHKDYMDGKITKEKFLNEYRNSKNYQPESPSSNRSRKYEKK